MHPIFASAPGSLVWKLKRLWIKLMWHGGICDNHDVALHPHQNLFLVNKKGAPRPPRGTHQGRSAMWVGKVRQDQGA